MNRAKSKRTMDENLTNHVLSPVHACIVSPGNALCVLCVAVLDHIPDVRQFERKVTIGKNSLGEHRAKIKRTMDENLTKHLYFAVFMFPVVMYFISSVLQCMLEELNGTCPVERKPNQTFVFC